MTLVKPAPDAQVREEKQNKRTWPFPHPKHGKRWLILGVIALLFLAFAGKFLLGQAAQVTLDGSFETLNGTVRSISGSKVVGTGNTVTREVTIAVQNPGGLSAFSGGRGFHQRFGQRGQRHLYLPVGEHGHSQCQRHRHRDPCR